MKSLKDLKEDLQEIVEGTFKGAHPQQGTRIERQYGSDIKVIPTGLPGERGYRNVRARAMVWDAAPDPRGIRPPQIGDDTLQDKDRTVTISNKYDRLYKKLANKIDSNNSTKISESFSNEEPPYILVLKRQNIRLYPGGIKLALYYNEKIKKYFSVPFNTNTQATVQAESLDNITENILSIIRNLNEENQLKFIDMLNNSNTFEKIKDFILNNIDGNN